MQERTRDRRSMPRLRRTAKEPGGTTARRPDGPSPGGRPTRPPRRRGAGPAAPVGDRDRPGRSRRAGRGAARGRARLPCPWPRRATPRGGGSPGGGRVPGGAPPPPPARPPPVLRPAGRGGARPYVHQMRGPPPLVAPLLAGVAVAPGPPRRGLTGVRGGLVPDTVGVRTDRGAPYGNLVLAALIPRRPRAVGGPPPQPSVLSVARRIGLDAVRRGGDPAVALPAQLGLFDQEVLPARSSGSASSSSAPHHPAQAAGEEIASAVASCRASARGSARRRPRRTTLLSTGPFVAAHGSFDPGSSSRSARSRFGCYLAWRTGGRPSSSTSSTTAHHPAGPARGLEESSSTDDHGVAVSAGPSRAALLRGAPPRHRAERLAHPRAGEVVDAGSGRCRRRRSASRPHGALDLGVLGADRRGVAHRVLQVGVDHRPHPVLLLPGRARRAPRPRGARGARAPRTTPRRARRRSGPST